MSRAYRKDHLLRPPKWVIDTGAMLYYGIFLFCIVTLLFGVALLVFAEGSS